MGFKSLKSFTLGKSKEKPAKDDAELKDIDADRIAKMEKRIYGRTRDLEEKAQQIQGLVNKSDKNGDIPLGPHGPLGELTLEADEKSTDLDILTAASESDDSEEGEEKVKLVEVNVVRVTPPIKASQVKLAEAITVPAKSPAKEKEIKLDDNNDSLGNLFSNDDEEVNPLANLINALPDVTAQELIDDLKEIKRIIKEWQPK